MRLLRGLIALGHRMVGDETQVLRHRAAMMINDRSGGAAQLRFAVRVSNDPAALLELVQSWSLRCALKASFWSSSPHAWKFVIKTDVCKLLNARKCI